MRETAPHLDPISMILFPSRMCIPDRELASRPGIKKRRDDMDPRTTVMRTTTTLSGLVLALVGCMHPGAAQTVAIPVVVSATANTPTCTLQAISFVTQYTETISSTLSMSNTFTDFT